MIVGRRIRVLFVGEALTLSHVVRPALLAAALAPERFDVHFAADPRYAHLLGELPFPTIPLASAVKDDAVERLAGGQPIFDAETLDRYVAEDVELIRDLRPDFVVGDMRQSLAVSARVERVPYVCVANAQWSPFARMDLELVDHPVMRMLPEPVSALVNMALFPAGSSLYAFPLNAVRLKHGLPPLVPPDARRVFSDGDYTLYPDVPEIVPTPGRPPTHRYIGTVLWNPKVELPTWWDDLPDDRPIVYVNLGSSGRQSLLGTILAALAPLQVTVIAATAGGQPPTFVPPNAFVAPYLPGLAAARRARLVICNGGGMPAQQALAAGTPVLGVTTNMDQVVFMKAVARTGAGAAVREREADEQGLRRAAWMLLHDERTLAEARRLAIALGALDAATEFRRFVEETFGTLGERSHG